MPYKSNNTNQQSSHPKGAPAGDGVGGEKPINSEESEDALHNMLRAKYTDGEDEPTIDVKRGSHPNRNTNKPSIDKPPYS